MRAEIMLIWINVCARYGARAAMAAFAKSWRRE
jgi:hypothetical protein